MFARPPTKSLKKHPGQGGDGLPSRQEAMVNGIIMSLCQQSPVMYAYLRDAEVDNGVCWLIFFRLPPAIISNLAALIDVKKKEAYQFQQNGVIFTALKLEPSEAEMDELNLSQYYHDDAKTRAKEKAVGREDKETSEMGGLPSPVDVGNGGGQSSALPARG